APPLWKVGTPGLWGEGFRCSSAPGEGRMGLDWIGFGYAALVTSGGIIGYAKAGSVPSLAAGLLFGSLAGLGAYQLSQNPKNVWLSLSESTLKYLCKTNLLLC
ncbi:transmembrane protein 14C, partial [Chelydra serpentina]